jgi:hypothetical protein
MSHTYRAILRGDRIEWIDPPPEQTQAVEVHVVMLASKAGRKASLERGQAMAQALETLAQRGTFATIEDPVAWQRERRQERVLPGR